MLISKPLTKKELKKIIGADGYLKVDVAVSLTDLFNGIEELNNLMDEKILKRGTLSDISYQVVGSIPPDPNTYIGGEVILRVTAEVENE